MITDGKKWHYLTVKKLSAFLKGITSNHKGDIYCLNCLYSYSTEIEFKKHKDVCYIEMPKKDNKVLKQTWRKIYESFVYHLYRFRVRLWYMKNKGMRKLHALSRSLEAIGV